MILWVNGRRARAVDVRDRGFNYGDGVFETMRVRRRAVRLLDFHLERLAGACRRLGLTPPSVRALRRELNQAAARRVDGVLKLIMTRGTGTRGYRPSGRERATRVLVLSALPRAARAQPPAQIRLCRMRLGSNPALAGLKTLNRLESVLARAEWRDPNIWEGLLRDADDHIVCGTMTNVFLRRGRRLLTPRVDRCGIDGVMRRWVLANAGRLALNAVETRLRWADLTRADEVFLTNAVAGIVPVSGIAAGRSRIAWPDHAAASGLQALLETQ